jgi:hypothetical protein
MTKTLLASIIATAAFVSLAAPASACPAGYVAGWIQGHKICHIKPGGNNQLKAQTAPQPHLVPPARKKVVQN